MNNYRCFSHTYIKLVYDFWKFSRRILNHNLVLNNVKIHANNINLQETRNMKFSYFITCRMQNHITVQYEVET
jgi:hypothetical protein